MYARSRGNVAEHRPDSAESGANSAELGQSLPKLGRFERNDAKILAQIWPTAAKLRPDLAARWPQHTMNNLRSQRSQCPAGEIESWMVFDAVAPQLKVSVPGWLLRGSRRWPCGRGRNASLHQESEVVPAP